MAQATIYGMFVGSAPDAWPQDVEVLDRDRELGSFPINRSEERRGKASGRVGPVA
jgi:hypothetical protein